MGVIFRIRRVIGFFTTHCKDTVPAGDDDDDALWLLFRRVSSEEMIIMTTIVVASEASSSSSGSTSDRGKDAFWSGKCRFSAEDASLIVCAVWWVSLFLVSVRV